MENLRLTETGRIIKTYGFRGEVLIRLADNIECDFDKIESLFLLVDGRAVPFMVEEVAIRGNQSLIARFRWYDTAESMAGFVGCQVLMVQEGDKAVSLPDHRVLEGFSVYDPEGRSRGIVKSIKAGRHQWLATVETAGGNSFLLPVHEDLVRGIDLKSRVLTIDIPEGLEEL